MTTSWPGHLRHRPGGAEGTPHSQLRAGASLTDSPGDVADVADRVDQGFGAGRVAADGDGHLAHPEGVEHVELPGRKGKVRRPPGRARSRVKVSAVSRRTR